MSRYEYWMMEVQIPLQDNDKPTNDAQTALALLEELRLVVMQRTETPSLIRLWGEQHKGGHE